METLKREDVITKYHDIIIKKIRSFLYTHYKLNEHFKLDDFYGDCAIRYIIAIDELLASGRLETMDELHIRNYLYKNVQYSIYDVLQKEFAKKRGLFITSSLVMKTKEDIEYSHLEHQNFLQDDIRFLNPETIVIRKSFFEKLNKQLTQKEKALIYKLYENHNTNIIAIELEEDYAIVRKSINELKNKILKIYFDENNND